MEECEFAAKTDVRFDRILKFRESFDADHIQKSFQFVPRSIEVEIPSVKDERATFTSSTS